jgi:hypothetical protein
VQQKEILWRRLFGYVDRLGHQLAGAVQAGASANQVVIVPFLTTGAMSSGGILPANWLALLTDIMSDLRATLTGRGGVIDNTQLEVVLAGFSAGFATMNGFRLSGATQGLAAHLKEIWDFDGFPKNLSDGLASFGSVVVTKYDQLSENHSLHLPTDRWSELPDPLPEEEPRLPDRTDPGESGFLIHHFIRDFMFLPAALPKG